MNADKFINGTSDLANLGERSKSDTKTAGPTETPTETVISQVKALQRTLPACRRTHATDALTKAIDTFLLAYEVG